MYVLIVKGTKNHNFTNEFWFDKSDYLNTIAVTFVSRFKSNAFTSQERPNLTSHQLKTSNYIKFEKLFFSNKDRDSKCVNQLK